MKENDLKVKMLSFDISMDNAKFVDVDGGVLVKDVLLLDQGTWTDSHMGTPLYYPAKTLETYHDNWVDNIIWSKHSGGAPRDATDVIGRVKNRSFKNTGMYGDLFFHCRTEKSKDVVNLIKAGEINAVSVEHFWKEQYNPNTKMYEATELTFRGLTPVDRGACKTCLIRRNHAHDSEIIQEKSDMNDEEIKKMLEGFKADFEAKFTGLEAKIAAIPTSDPGVAEAKVAVGELSKKVEDLVKEMNAKDERIKELEKKPQQKGVAIVAQNPNDKSSASGVKIDPRAGTISKI